MTGSGTASDPYIIYDVNDLQAMNNDLSAYYELANDIDASATVGWNGGLGFVPVGNDTDGRFAGHFDGKGYEIDSLFIDRTAPEPVTEAGGIGLFGRTTDATIQNVGVTNCDIKGTWYVGALIGNFEGGVIQSCYSSGTVEAENYDAGGLLGSMAWGSSEPIVASNCHSSANVTQSSSGGRFAGGFASALLGTITDCYATGDVSAGDDAGGFVAKNGATISRCYATGNVSTTGLISPKRAGGFVASATYPGTIADCYARGNVTGESYVAGFVASGFQTITNCYSTGAVVSTTGDPKVGGFCADETGPTIVGCFWDTQTSGIATSFGGTGKTTAQMKAKSTFTNAAWNFGVVPTIPTENANNIGLDYATLNGDLDDIGSEIWDMCAGINNDYPCLLDVTPSCPGHVIVCDSRGFDWGLTAEYGNSWVEENSHEVGLFDHDLTGLYSSTVYQFRAKAHNNFGWGYGENNHFITGGYPVEEESLVQQEVLLLLMQQAPPGPVI